MIIIVIIIMITTIIILIIITRTIFMVLSSQHTYSNKSSSLSDKYQVASDRWIKPIDSGHLTM